METVRVRAPLLLAAPLALACGSDTPTNNGSNPLPALLSLDPPLVLIGSASGTVELAGSGFIEGSRARLDGSDRVTAYVDAQTLTMSLQPADLESGGAYEVTVVNGPPGGGESGTATLTVGYPEPSVSALDPAEADAGAGGLTLTVDGAGFVQGASVVRFGSTSLPTTFVGPTRLTAQLSASHLAQPGFLDVRVSNPGPGGGASTPVQFTVRQPVPVALSVSPATIVAGTATRISVVGEHFRSSTQISWNGATYPSQVVSASVLYADLPASAFSATGAASMAVWTPPPGGGLSSSLPVVVVAPPPRITGFSPPSAQAGGAALTLTVHGVDFVAGSEVFWNGVARAATVVNATTLTLQLSASDIALPGSGMVRVRSPGGGESPVVGFPIVEDVATVTDTLTVAVESADLVADPDDDVVYVAVPASAASYANELVALDASTGAVLWHTPVGSDPNKVVISDDGAYLYVGLAGASAVARVDVAAQAKDLDILLDAGRRSEDIVVVPGSPTTIAVSLRNTCCSPRHEGVALYSGATRLPLLTQGHTGSNRIEPGAHAQRIYGYNNETTEFGFRRILVRSDGLLQDGVYSGLVDGFGTDIIYDGGLVFTTSRRVIEPESRTLLGTISAASGVIRPDVANGRVHFLSGGTLSAYHYASFTLLGSIPVPATGLSALVRVGSDGMAFGGGSRVVFVRSPLIGS